MARTPPRFVPTLTAVIDAEPAVGDDDAALEEALMQRVLERVDRSLEDQISDVVAAEVQAQLDVMVPRLRSEIEKVLRRLVTDALVRERAAASG